MSHLTPVVRPDINGKMVTRHVRSSLPASSASAIPAVSSRQMIVGEGSTLKVAKGSRLLLAGLKSAIPAGEIPFLHHQPKELAAKIRELPDEVLETVHEADTAISDPVDRRYLQSMVIKAVDCDASSVDIESAVHYFMNSDRSVRENIDEYFEFGSSANGIATYPIGNLISAVKAYDLDGFSFDPELPIGKQDERTVEQCNALKQLHYAVEEAERWDEPVPVFADDKTLIVAELAQMVVDRPETVDDIIDIIDERRTLDFDLIASILASDATALREGTL